MIGVALFLYSIVLRAYPPSLRGQYGSLMIEEARAMLLEGKSAGFTAFLQVTFRLIVDAGVSLPREWRRSFQSGLPRVGRRTGGIADLRYALRSYRRTPGVTVLAVGTLALGIGASTALFGLVDAALLRPLPFPNSNELVVLWPDRLFSRSMLDLVRRESRAHQGVTAYDGAILSLVSGGEPTEVVASGVPQGHFAVVDIKPVLGRAFVPEEHGPGASPVVILSHRLWLERFGGAPDVMGDVIELAGQGATQRTVVGVMPQGYRPLLFGSDVWIPMVFDRTAENYEDSYVMTAIARMKSDVSLVTARADLTYVASLAREQWPGHFSEQDVSRAQVVPLKDALVGDARPRLVVLTVAVALMLLAACFNVANLLLARGKQRRSEIAVRSALGAGRSRILRQLVTESLLLAVIGGGLGLVAASILQDVLLLAVPGIEGVELRTDARFFGFAAIISVLAALVGGVLPGWHAAGVDPGSVLRGVWGGPSKSAARSQDMLLVCEVALATTLAFAATLLVTSVHEMKSVPIGFDANQTTTFRLTAPAVSDNDERVVGYFEKVRSALLDVPGVADVGMVSRLPMDGGSSRVTIFPEGYEPDAGPLPMATHRLVSAGFFDALGVRVIEGRDLTEGEVHGGPLVGLVNQALATRFWPGGSAIGKRFFGRGGVVWFEIVGVVDDVLDDGPTETMKPTVYLPHRDWAWRTMSVAVRPDRMASVSIEQLKQAVWRVNPEVPITRVQTVGDILNRAVRKERLTGLMTALFAGFAVLLSAIGVAGVVAHTVAERQREFGIRSALGASNFRLLRSELERAGRVLLGGLAVGVVGSLAAGRLLRSMVFAVSPNDPVLLLLVAVGVAVLALLAAFIPARRGTAVDPAGLLRA